MEKKSVEERGKAPAAITDGSNADANVAAPKSEAEKKKDWRSFGVEKFNDFTIYSGVKIKSKDIVIINIMTVSCFFVRYHVPTSVSFFFDKEFGKSS